MYRKKVKIQGQRIRFSTLNTWSVRISYTAISENIMYKKDIAKGDMLF